MDGLLITRVQGGYSVGQEELGRLWSDLTFFCVCIAFGNLVIERSCAYCSVHSHDDGLLWMVEV